MEKLTYLNLSSNIILALSEFNNLRSLVNLKVLKVHLNPVAFDPLCETYIKKILDEKANFKIKTSTSNQNIVKSTLYRQSRVSVIQQNKYSFEKKNQPKLKFKRTNAIRRVALEDQTDYTTDTDYLSDAFNERATFNYGSSPVVSDFDSDRIQRELNLLKNSRMKFGEQWLLSSPNLSITPQVQKSDTNINIDDRALSKRIKSFSNDNSFFNLFNY